MVQALALNNGVVDIELNRFRYDPARPAADRLTYQASVRLREGVWECPKLPFPVNDLVAWFDDRGRRADDQARPGSNGQTTLRAEGIDRPGRPRRLPLDLQVELIDLELDQRLRDR